AAASARVEGQITCNGHIIEQFYLIAIFGNVDIIENGRSRGYLRKTGSTKPQSIGLGIFPGPLIKEIALHLYGTVIVYCTRGSVVDTPLHIKCGAGLDLNDCTIIVQQGLTCCQQWQRAQENQR